MSADPSPFPTPYVVDPEDDDPIPDEPDGPQISAAGGDSGAPRDASPLVERAAGTVLWRRHKGRLLVALIHRQRYDDWSWPKGKLDEGEDWPVAAARETQEETGLAVRLGPVLPGSSYPLTVADGRPAVKEVRYWSAVPVGGDGRLRHEVDSVAWLTPEKAQRRLTYERDREQLAALVEAETQRRLRTWPLVVVRHAKAVPRKQWSKADWRRPLDERGARESAALVPLLRAYAVERVVTSSATRCILTVKPYARSAKLKIHSTAVLSEEGFEDRPHAAAKRFAAILSHGDAAAVCTHGPVLPPLLTRLAELADPKLPGVREALATSARENLEKGEILVAHMATRGKSAHVVAVERHTPMP